MSPNCAKSWSKLRQKITLARRGKIAAECMTENAGYSMLRFGSAWKEQ